MVPTKRDLLNQIQLDEVYRRPELLATVLFATFFLFVPNTDGNALQFAKHVLLAAEPSITRTEELDKRLITLIAITILATVCLLHCMFFCKSSPKTEEERPRSDPIATGDVSGLLLNYLADAFTDFSRNSGLLLNLVFAAYKIVLLTVFIIAACVFSSGPNNGRSDWDDPHNTNRQPIAALVYIVYSYQGERDFVLQYKILLMLTF